jgi:hypothetical protein
MGRAFWDSFVVVCATGSVVRCGRDERFGRQKRRSVRSDVRQSDLSAQAFVESRSWTLMLLS